MSDYPQLPVAFLGAQFPFYFTVGTDMRIVAGGRSIARAAGRPILGERFGEAFHVVRPTVELNFEGLRAAAGKVFVIDSPTGCRLRGQFVESGPSLTFLGSPWVAAAEDLQRWGLSFSDFAPHDPALDFVPLLQTQRLMLDEARSLAEELEVQRNEAQIARERLQLQYEVTRILSYTEDRLAARREIIRTLTELMHWDAGSSWLQVDPNSMHMACVAHNVLEPEKFADYGPLTQATSCRFGAELPGYAWWAKEAVWVEDLHKEAFRYGEDAERYAPFASGVVFPVLARGEVVGAVELLSATRRPVDEDFLRLLEGVGLRIGEYIERRISEAELVKSEADYRLVVESVQEVIFRTSAEGTWTFLNPAWTRVTGFGVDETLGTLFLDYVHPEDREKNVCEFQKLLQGEKAACRHEVRYLTRSGEYRWIEVYALLLRGSRGELLGTAGTLMDITERKTSEAALVHARDEANRANRAKSEFLSRMSHELRTPLNAVLGFGQLLEMSGLDQPMSDQVGYILAAGNHLLQLIDEVLDIARIESGRLAIKVDDVEFGPLLDEALQLVARAAEERHIVCHQPGACDLTLRADRQRTKQVLVNLLSNAVKYNREFGQLYVECLAASDGVARISVSDTGHGIEPDLLDRVFAPFDRAGAERSTVPGTGLGLALSKALVEAMDGRIGVKSAPGVGSTFWFELPLAVPRARAVEPPGESHARATILCIDDSLEDIALVRGALAGESAAFGVLPALQGALGLELARLRAPDLILLDLHLPDMFGTEVLAALKADSRTRGIPVIVTTADSTPGIEQVVERLGAAALVAKPLPLAKLRAAIDSCLAA